MKSFSEKLKDARENMDMSQAELAEKVGLSQRSITAYENEGTVPRGGTLKKLARALNVSVEYLMNDEVENPQEGKDKEVFVDTARSITAAKEQKKQNYC